MLVRSQNKHFTPQRKKTKHISSVCIQRAALPPTAVLYDYVDAYSRYICQGGSPECIQAMVVPPPEEQLNILRGLVDASTQVDIRGFEGTLMMLLSVHDEGAVETLLESLYIYHQAIHVLQSIVDYSHQIPLNTPMDFM